MHEVQQAYIQAREENERLEGEAMRQLEATGVLHTPIPDWDLITITHMKIMQELGVPESNRVLKQATRALEQFALEWTIQHGTAEDVGKVRRAIESPLTSVTGFKEPFIQACLNLS